MLDILLVAVVSTAVFTDLASNKIYNSLCLFALIAGFALHWSDGGISTALLTLAAALIAGLVFLPFYVLGGMAAGDVKLMAACASIVGWPHGIYAAGVSLLCGTILGIAYYFVRGGAKEFISRYSAAVRYLWIVGRVFVSPAPADSVARTRFPYALAIAAGSLITQFFIAP